jgi:hypothetical protein
MAGNRKRELPDDKSIPPMPLDDENDPSSSIDPPSEDDEIDDEEDDEEDEEDEEELEDER